MTTRFALLGLLSLFATGIAFATTPYMGAATFAYGLMISGMYFRKTDNLAHRRMMYSAMAIDLSLVLLLEAQRNAIGTVIAMDLGILPFAHVACSTLALLLYGPMILLGRKLTNDDRPGIRLWHRRLGITAFCFRTLGFFLMFSLLGRAPGQ